MYHKQWFMKGMIVLMTLATSLNMVSPAIQAAALPEAQAAEEISALPYADSAASLLEAAPAGWTAYNDVVYDPTQIGVATDPNGQSVHYIGSNVTTFGIGSGFTGSTSGELIDQATGTPTGVTATLTQNGGVVWQPDTNTTWYGGHDPAPGTDAYNTFNGIADMTGVVYYADSAGWWVDLTLTGLDPAKEYTFATSAVRAGSSSYADRISLYTLSGADGLTNASTSGVTEVAPNAVSFVTGTNYTEGYVARWTDIQPGSDGSITVRAEAGSSQYKAYTFDVFMLHEEEGTTPTQYTLDVSIVGHGSVVLDPPEGLYDENTTVSVEAIADSGWAFDGWSVDLSGSDNPKDILMDGNKVVTATFVESAPVTGWIAYNDLNNLLSTNAPNVTEYTYEATNAVLKNYLSGANLTVTMTGSTFGSTLNGYDPQDNGDNVTNTASDAYQVFNGIVDLAGVMELDAADWDNILTFDNLDPAKSYAITLTTNRDNTSYANQRFSRVTIEGADTFTNASSTGVIVYGEDSVSFSAGYNTLNGYVAKWTGVTAGADGSFSIKSEWDNTQAGTKGYAMSAFRLEEETGAPPTQYTLDVTVVGNGTVDQVPDKTLYNEGETVNLTANADPGWVFDGWSVDLSGSANPETLLMNANKTVTATFIETGGLMPGDVIISGYQSWNTPDGQNPGEFIEIFNTTNSTISLENMDLITRLDQGSGDGTVDLEWQLSATSADLTGKTIAPHSFFLVGESGVAAPSGLHDVEVDMDLATGEGGYLERAISVELTIDGTHMDYFLYGRDDGSSPAGALPPGDLPFNGSSWPRAEVIRNTTGDTSFQEGLIFRETQEDLFAGYAVEGYYTDEDALGDGYPNGVWTSEHEGTFGDYEARNSLSPAVSPPTPEAFAFVVASDWHTSSYFNNVTTNLGQIKTWIDNPTTEMPAPEFLVIVGDFPHYSQTEDRIDTVIGPDFLWYPVIGNHEISDDINNFYTIRDTVVPSLPNIDDYGPAGSVNTNYSWSVGNAHFVAINAYWDGTTGSSADRSADGNITEPLRNWIGTNLSTFGDTHNFVFVHEPAYPDVRHEGDSLDKYPANRDAFASMLDTNNAEALFTGHTHYYTHYTSDDYPLIGDVHHISDGNMSRIGSEDGSTIVYVLVQGSQTTYKVFRSNSGPPFALAYEWVVEQNPATEPPAAPSNLTATAVSAAQINLEWQDNASNESGFEIERSDAGSAFAPLTTVPANTQAYNNTGLTAETEYCYRVRATNAFGDSAYVGPVCETTGASTPTTGWIAYNDLNNALSTNAANVTEYTYEATDAVLKNYLSGADLSVTMTGSTLPDNYDPYENGGNVTNTASDAYQAFNGIVDLPGVMELDEANWDHILTFDNLDPAKSYAITLTNNRDNPSYTDQRFTRVTIEGAIPLPTPAALV